jgi:hypothetical protein
VKHMDSSSAEVYIYMMEPIDAVNW